MPFTSCWRYVLDQLQTPLRSTDKQVLVLVPPQTALQGGEGS